MPESYDITGTGVSNQITLSQYSFSSLAGLPRPTQTKRWTVSTIVLSSSHAAAVQHQTMSFKNVCKDQIEVLSPSNDAVRASTAVLYETLQRFFCFRSHRDVL
ncbi:hypothetical protein F2P81_017530 [Scophthalmus maximus]|uniref:Uncharacterized protein n=1 Tax=Scophthalmus maximus TaxID=52904 RepID=A0A6A4SE57_SCOMX|nr:hypothetical protein F2P81_017530 [Scophthalmus maximus]